MDLEQNILNKKLELIQFLLMKKVLLTLTFKINLKKTSLKSWLYLIAQNNIQ